MRSINYEDWKKQKAARRRAVLSVENKFEGRVAGNRPRDPEKEELLAKLDLARRARYIETGKLQKIGPRVWKWRIDFKEQD